MARFVMRFRGETSERESQIARIQNASGVHVADSSPSMLLVETSEETISELQKALPDWSVSPERLTSLPGPVLPHEK